MEDKLSEYLTTGEIARLLHLNEKKIYKLAAENKIPSIRISGKWLFRRDLVEQYLRENTSYPREGIVERVLADLFIIGGSDDFLFKEIISQAGKRMDYSTAFGVCGTAGGLQMLSDRHAHAATVHFLVDNKKFSSSAIREDAYLISLYKRRQGFMSRKGSGAPVHSSSSLIERNLTIAVREKACGTYHLTAEKFASEGHDLNAYEKKTSPFLTHISAAQAVASGDADVAVGIQRVALLFSLEFSPIQEEDFYLIIPSRFMADKKVMSLMDTLLECIQKTPSDMREGYDISIAGRIKAVHVQK